jgi:autotransporter-associated beta strand protein
LTFFGTGTLNVGRPLAGYTNAAALNVINALTLGGLTGGVTVNLPTAAVGNGIYHLVQFGSGITDVSGFALGTVPTPSFGQIGVLQVDGNYLDYVVSSPVVNNSPVLVSTIPVNNATGVSPTAQLTANFSENIVAGSGNIELHKSSDGSLVASYSVTSSPQIGFNGTQLIIQPTSNQLTNQQYYMLIPAGAVQDQSGNSFSGLTSSSNWTFTVTTPPVLYTDTGSPANPPWIQVSNTIVSAGYDGANYPGPVYGSLINVNNAAVEVGLYGNRPISVPNQRIQVSCNTSTSSFGNFTRWFQTDGNTQILRVFVNDQNTATARTGVSEHNEAYMGGGWNYTDNVTYEWTGHYTLAHILQGFATFQLKNSVNDWAFQLELHSDGSLAVNNRYGAYTVVTNSDGSTANFTDSGFDVRVLDDGLNYKVWINGVLYSSGSFSRPTGTTTFRWGMYFGANCLNPPSDYNLLLVSGAQIKSWSGNLATANATITKNNNTSNLDTGTSWVGGAAPGLYNQAVWNNTVTAANATTLAADQEWAGIKIVNPGGAVTINGTKTLILNSLGVDLTAATQNLTLNCPMQMAVSSTLGVAPGRTATFNGAISGYPNLTVSGGGTVNLGTTNSYVGNTTINAGTLQLGANDVIPNGSGYGNISLSGTLDMHGFSDTINGLSGAGTVNNTAGGSPTLTVGGNDQSSTFSGTITNTAGTLALAKTGAGTLTLSGTNGYSGATTVNGGMLQIGVSGVGNSVTIANSGFETPTISGWTYSPSGASWSFSGAGIDHNSGTWYTSTSHEGAQAAFIQGAGSISQFITAGAAGLYAITFQAIGRAGTYGPEGIIIQVDGVAVATWAASALSQSQWQNYQATANLTAGNHTLTFVGNNTLGGDKSVAIDKVQIFQPLGTGLLPLATDVNLSGGLGATLDLGGAAQTIGSLAGAAGSSVINNGSLTTGGDGLSTSFAGVISGAGSLTKIGVGAQTLSGANTYTGGTIISNGTLLVNGSAGAGAVTVISGGTLGGTGTIAGNVTNSGTLLPGAGGAGTLTINNLTLKAGSTNTLTVNGSTLAQTSIAVGGNATYGGVLNIVTNGTFIAGQNFTLFSGAGATNTSNFASIAGNPGVGMAFNFTNGVLSVVANLNGPNGPAKLTNNISGSTLSLSWPAGQGWRLQMQTNRLSVGLNTNWVYITDGTISSTNVTTSPTNPTVFYRLTYP